MRQGSNRHNTKGDSQMTNKHVRRCSTPYVSKEMKIKTRYHSIFIKMVKVQNTDNATCWERSGATETVIH